MTRDEIEALLPFWVNGTLSGEERAAVAKALKEDEALAAEARALSAIRTRMQAEDVRSPGEFGLARLMREVKAQGAIAPRSAWGSAGLWQVAAAAMLAVALAAVFLSNPQGGGDYRLAGEAPAFTVSFADSATEAEIRDTLLAAGVEIVSGPSALGLYGLTPLPEIDPGEAAAVLGSATAIVTSIERSDE